MSDKTFDPSKYLRKLGKGDYLEVRWRVLWLRTEHPDAVIETEMVRLDANPPLAVFRAKVSIPGGGSATGWGSEEPKDFPDFIEKSECLREDAEILTRRGFVHHSGLTIGEDVLAYDLRTDTCVWTPVRQIAVYHDAEVVRLGGRWFEAYATPNHSWATAGTYRSWVSGVAPRRLRETSNLRTSDKLILAAPAPGGDSDLTADEAAILGWLFTDGTLWKGDGSLRPAIYQTKRRQVEQIRALVGVNGIERAAAPATIRTFPSGRTYATKAGRRWDFKVGFIRELLERLGVHCTEDLPAAVTRLSAPARAAMREAMMDADGDARGYFGKLRKPGVQEAWQILNTLDGIAVGPARNIDVFPVQRAKRRRYLSCSELTVTPAGRATVWCPTTAHGTWVTRLPNGQITITGNTKAIGRALAALGFGTQFCYDFDLGEGESQRLADAPVARPNAARPAPVREVGPPVATVPQVQAIYAIGRQQGRDEAQMDALCQSMHGALPRELPRRVASEWIGALKQGEGEPEGPDLKPDTAAKAQPAGGNEPATGYQEFRERVVAGTVPEGDPSPVEVVVTKDMLAGQPVRLLGPDRVRCTVRLHNDRTVFQSVAVCSQHAGVSWYARISDAGVLSGWAHGVPGAAHCVATAEQLGGGKQQAEEAAS